MAPVYRQLLLKNLVLSLLISCSGDPCAEFTFPSVEGSVLTTEENSTVKLQFQLNAENCSTDDYIKIRIQKRLDGNNFKDQCTIRKTGKHCRLPLHNTGCACLEEDSLYQLTKVVDRTDNAEWVWTWEGGDAKEANLSFNITYPASIQKVSVGPEHDEAYTAELNSSVDLLCVWQNGNPSVKARLLNRHGVEMEGSIYSSGHIRNVFPAVGCQDAGLIRCEAPGASHNKTAKLLVKCPPEFAQIASIGIVPVPGEKTELLFRVRMHTREVTDCRLRPLDSWNHVSMSTITQPTNRGSVTSPCTITGTPPDLTLTVRMDNVRKEEEGQWRLELTNDVGTGQLDFDLRVTWGLSDVTDTSTSTTHTTLSDTSGLSFFTNWKIMTPTGVSVVLIVIIVVAIVCKRRRGGSGRTQSPTELQREAELAMNLEERLSRPRSAASVDSHAYCDIGDIQPLPTAGNAPDNYLQAIARPPECYERPEFEEPAYTSPNPVYQPLRHLYDNLRVRVQRVLMRHSYA